MATYGPTASRVIRSLRKAGIEDESQYEAAAFLAKRYARLIDATMGTEEEYDTIKDLGPKLLQTLAALGLTHTATRGVVREGVGNSDRSNAPEDELAALRAARGAGTR